ncbi:MAG: hypothetical protein KBG15_19660 [Kofleriaceae bacterium]|nr:hypothetical protein [Kofleriaceae bacterium]
MTEIRALPPKEVEIGAENPAAGKDDGDGLALAGAISHLTGFTAFWLCQCDHSGVGGYARFDRGELVDPPRQDAVVVDGDGYIEVPVSRWSDALGMQVDSKGVFRSTFPDENEPPLRSMLDPRLKIRFAPEQHKISLEYIRAFGADAQLTPVVLATVDAQ